MIDVLFITRLEDSAEAPEPQNFRLVLNGETATLDCLRRYAGIPSCDETLAADAPQDRQPFPVLTFIQLNEYLKKHGVSMVEIPSFQDDFDKVRSALKEGVRLIAFCSTWLDATNGAAKLRKAVKTLKSLSPGTPVIVGGMAVLKALRIRRLIDDRQFTGVFPSWFENSSLTRGLTARLLRRTCAPHFLLFDAKADSCIDGIALDEAGETTLLHILEAYRAGQDLRQVPNLAVPEHNRYTFTAREENNIDLDAGIIDWTDYVPGLQGEEAPLRRGTGCPYKCAFCDFTGLQKLRVRSAESMIAELKTLTRAGHWDVHFVDDNIAYSRKQLAEFARAIIKERLNISWRSFLRSDTIDAETAALLKESGCSEIMMGVESGDPQVLKNMNKGIDPDSVIKAAHCLDAEGIRTRSFFIVGFPGECARSLENTASLISAFPSGDNARALHRYYPLKFNVSPLSTVASPEQRKKFALKGVAGSWSHSTMTSKEVPEAMRRLFLAVKGPTHLYSDVLLADCDMAGTRKVMELREAVQKERVSGREGDIEALLAAVRAMG